MWMGLLDLPGFDWIGWMGPTAWGQDVGVQCEMI